VNGEVEVEVVEVQSMPAASSSALSRSFYYEYRGKHRYNEIGK
jgi:hypothetical protein